MTGGERDTISTCQDFATDCPVTNNQCDLPTLQILLPVSSLAVLPGSTINRVLPFFPVGRTNKKQAADDTMAAMAAETSSQMAG